MAIKRLQILQEVQTRLNTLIVGSGGYYTDVREKVFVFRTTPFQAHEVPGINITRSRNDHGSELIAPARATHPQVLMLDISFVCLQGETSNELAEKMLTDIYKAIGTDVTWGGLAYDTVPISDEIDVDEVADDRQGRVEGVNTQIIGGGRVTIQIHYRTPEWAES